ncbi:MAG TPA: acetolactate synthase [Actinomycetota bacterium]|nr:acetolactate synthase [Actinomycetota bacterium]
MSDEGHGGQLIARALKALGINHLFTLTGGHIFPIIDGCHLEDIALVDVRHEQTAAFAAEAMARLSRSVAAAAVTAGPGVTNTMSALAQAGFNCAPLLCLGGRAPIFRWGQGSLQEIEHGPFVDPLAPARTVMDPSELASAVFAAALAAMTPPRGPRFLDFPVDVMFNPTSLDPGTPGTPDHAAPDPDAVDVVARLLSDARKPVLVAGSNVWLDGAEGALRRLAETAGLPVFMSGQGRGCLPADHRLSFSRARSAAFKGADLVIVAGTPMDFRLGFGQFGPDAKVVHFDSHPDLIATHVEVAASIGARLDLTLAALADSGATPETTEWIEVLSAEEKARSDKVQEELHSDANPIHPMRIYGELSPLLDRDAIVIGDGGDFVSYAGREIASYEPGCWLDPGPFGCLGVGAGYSIAAKTLYPDRQVVVLYGDGAIGFSGMELETLVRLGLPVVCVIGNNGIWGLEKHPMRALYGYDVVTDLRPGIRYDKVMEAFGGRGYFVTEPDEIGGALKEALASGEPAVVNVVTDPDIAYPRSSNLL